MIVTQKLQESFDNNRKEYPSGRLDYLISLGINPEFAEKCEFMFNDIRASVDEVVAVTPEIKNANLKINALEVRSSGKVINLTRKASNDRTYGGIDSMKKAA
ncbi:MAG: hypothetical protein PHH98_00475 [Candidatus Gracilibacteria bacterium]|nr:hypothetical protein [Candidatus Gracilibacteria bacterium]